ILEPKERNKEVYGHQNIYRSQIQNVTNNQKRILRNLFNKPFKSIKLDHILENKD
ncbi:13117_t:CDS:1, partial [Gigaspora margarita]